MPQWGRRAATSAISIRKAVSRRTSEGLRRALLHPGPLHHGPTDSNAGKRVDPKMKYELVEDLSRLAESILEEIPYAVIYADDTGTIKRWNQAAAALFGYSAAQAF